MAKVKFLVVYCLFISGLCCMANVTKDINMRFKDEGRDFLIKQSIVSIRMNSDFCGSALKTG